MKLITRQLVQTALLLTICILSQYFKNLSVYITGPIVNATIVIATLAIGLSGGIIISLIAPITGFFFTGSPIMAAIPLMFPVIMLGNIILAVTVWCFQNKLSFSNHLPAGLLTASVLKSSFLGITVVLILLPMSDDRIASKVLTAAKVTFSFTQLITALIGCTLAFLIWIPLKRYLKNENVKANNNP